ncbi:MAG: STAS domain-containing protein [Phycisphaerales bacterium]|jgi:anti-sigma B factor antagonist|nr:STAS domain-containing protein [Phycisphaerales bacterium]
MKITFEDHDRKTVIGVQGTLSVDETDTFRRAFLERINDGKIEMVLDLLNLEMIDSAGLELLLWLSEEVSRCGGQLRLVRPSEAVGKIFSITRLEQRFSMHDSVESAARSLV